MATVQAQLGALNFYDGEITAKFDNRTKEAVKTYQKVKGLAVDGRAGPATRGALDSDCDRSDECVKALALIVD